MLKVINCIFCIFDAYLNYLLIMQLKNLLVLAMLMKVNIATYGQAGKIDSTFLVSNENHTAAFSVSCAAIQSDGKIIVGGKFKKFNNLRRRKVLRLHVDGSIDTTFAVGYKINRTVNTIAILKDGKIIVGGSFLKYNGQRANCIVKLNSDGSIDKTFLTGRGFGANDEIKLVRIQDDGKILLQGNFSYYNSYKSCGIVRLWPNGTVDSSFKGKTLCNVECTMINDMVLQDNGKIIIAGNFWEYDKVRGKGIARLNTDGSLDKSFLSDGLLGIANGSISAVAIQKDGKLIIGGSFTRFAGTKVRYLIRMNDDGSLDSTFAPIYGPNSFIEMLVIQEDGKIVIGTLKRYNKEKVNYLARIFPDGTLDSSFKTNEGFHFYTVHTLLLQADGKILALGPVLKKGSFYKSYIVRILN